MPTQRLRNLVSSIGDAVGLEPEQLKMALFALYVPVPRGRRAAAQAADPQQVPLAAQVVIAAEDVEHVLSDHPGMDLDHLRVLLQGRLGEQVGDEVRTAAHDALESQIG